MSDERAEIQRAEITIQLGKSMELGIGATRPEVDLESPLYAVNLLDEKRPRFYALYGLLALPSVRKAGGRVLLKARREGAQLAGRPEEDRGTILVVRYPEARAFLDLIVRPFFVTISWLRRRGIRGFQFGFAERLDGGAEPPEKPRRHRGEEPLLVHVVNADLDTPLSREGISELTDSARRAGLEMVFAGYRSAVVGGRRPGTPSTILGPVSPAPPLPWEGVFVLSGPDRQALVEFFDSPSYSAFRETLAGETAGLFRREY
jgi:uncharacterized protein (DUF1330 family)